MIWLEFQTGFRPSPKAQLLPRGQSQQESLELDKCPSCRNNTLPECGNLVITNYGLDVWLGRLGQVGREADVAAHPSILPNAFHMLP